MTCPIWDIRWVSGHAGPPATTAQWQVRDQFHVAGGTRNWSSTPPEAFQTSAQGAELPRVQRPNLEINTRRCCSQARRRRPPHPHLQKSPSHTACSSCPSPPHSSLSHSSMSPTKPVPDLGMPDPSCQPAPCQARNDRACPQANPHPPSEPVPTSNTTPALTPQKPRPGQSGALTRRSPGSPRVGKRCPVRYVG
jgi:hypothetical protein